MATKINRKFLTVIFLFGFIALAVVGGIAYLQISGAPERNRNLGDMAMAEAEAALAKGDAAGAKRQFMEAMGRYGRAVSKRPNNVEYIDLMRGALERIVPTSGSEASELYQRWLGVLQQRVRARPEDSAGRMDFINAARQRAELVEAAESWKFVSSVCDDALAALAPEDPLVKVIRRMRAEAEIRRDSVLTEEERDQAERQLRELLDKDPSDGIAWGLLLTSINADATRLQRAGRQADAQRRRKELDDALAKAKAAAPGSPEVLLAEYDVLLSLRSLNDPAVTPSRLVEMGAPLVSGVGQLSPGQMLEVAERVAATGDPDLIRAMAQALRTFCERNPDALTHLRMMGVLEFGVDREGARATLESLASRPPLRVSLMGAYQDELRAFAMERLGDLAFIAWEEAPDDAARSAAIEKLKATRTRLRDMLGERGGEAALARMDAKTAFAERKWVEASAKIDEVLANQPVTPPEFYLIAAQVLVNRGEFGTALSRIDRGLEAYPGSVPMLAVRGEILIRLGRLPDAGRTIAAIRAVDATSPAASGLEQMIDGLRTGAAGSDQVGEMLGRAEALYAEGKLEDALRMIEQALPSGQSDIRLHRAKSQVLLALQRNDEAKQAIEVGLAVLPGDENLVRLRAIAAGGSPLERLERVVADLPADEKVRATRRVLLLSQLRQANRNAAASAAPDAKAKAEAELAQVEVAFADARAKLAQLSPGDPVIFELAFNEAIESGDMAAAETAAANAESSCSDRSMGAVLRGRLALERGDWPLAVTELERARSTRGAPAAVSRLLGMARERSGDVAGALEAFAEAYQRQPSDTMNVRLYGSLLARAGDTARALDMLRSAAAANPEELPLINAWLELESQFGSRAGALEQRRRLMRERPSDRDNALRLAVMLVELEPTVEMLVDESGRPRYTREQFDALAPERRRDEIANVRSRNTREGMEIAQRLIALNPKDRDTPLAIARALRRVGDQVGGAKLLRESVTANAGPQEWIRWCDLAVYFLESDAIEAAEEAFARARSMQPAEGMPANRFEGQVWFQRGQWDRARKAIEPVHAAKPAPETARNLAEILVKLGEFDLARQTLSTLDTTKLSRRDQFTDSMLAAVIAEGSAAKAYAAGDIAKGDAESRALAEALDKSIALEPGDARPWIVRAGASHARYQRTGDSAALEQARTEADRAFELQPTAWASVRQRCTVMVDQGDLRGAIETVRKFVNAFPRLEDGRRALMTYLLIAGDTGNALAVVEEAIRIEPRNRAWYEMLSGAQISAGKPLDAARTLERGFEATSEVDLLNRAIGIRQSASPPDNAGILAAIAAAPTDVAQTPYVRLVQAAASAAEAKSRVSRDGALATLRELRSLVGPSLGVEGDRIWTECARTAFPADKPDELERYIFDAFGGNPPATAIAVVAEGYGRTGAAGAGKAESLAKMAVDAAKDPRTRAAALVLQSKLLYQNGKPMESAGALAQAVEAAPSDFAALNNLAYLQVTELNQVAEGVRNARRAVALAPDSPDILDTLGLALTRSGEHSEAVVMLSRAASIQSNNATLLHLAEAQIGKGDMAAARRSIERVQASRPTPDESDRAGKLLLRIGSSPAGS